MEIPKEKLLIWMENVLVSNTIVALLESKSK